MLIFNGKNLEDYGVTVIGRGTYGAPARDIEVVHVPGRNGDVIFDNGGFLNQVITYPECCIEERFAENFAGLRNFLLSTSDYCELRDDYHPEEYRLARFNGPIEPDVHTARNNRSGTFDLSFDCLPQRFLNSGAKFVDVPYFVNQGSEYTARLFFDNVNRTHTINVKLLYSDTVKVTAGGSTQTQTGKETTFSVPSGISYADITVSTMSSGNLSYIAYDEQEYSFEGNGRAVSSGGEIYTVLVNDGQKALPIWELSYTGISGTAAATIYNDTADADGMAVTRTTDQAKIYIDLDAMIFYGQTSGGRVSDALVTGGIPVLLPGKNHIRITADNALTRVRVRPNWWRV